MVLSCILGFKNLTLKIWRQNLLWGLSYDFFSEVGTQKGSEGGKKCKNKLPFFFSFLGHILPRNARLLAIFVSDFSMGHGGPTNLKPSQTFVSHRQSFSLTSAPNLRHRTRLNLCTPTQFLLLWGVNLFTLLLDILSTLTALDLFHLQTQ